METCEDIRHTTGMKELYAKRKETIERLFGTAKEAHGFRYTNMIGKARMLMKTGLTFACLNLKKLAKMKDHMGLLDGPDNGFSTEKMKFLSKNTKITRPWRVSKTAFVFSLKRSLYRLRFLCYNGRKRVRKGAYKCRMYPGDRRKDKYRCGDRTAFCYPASVCKARKLTAST